MGCMKCGRDTLEDQVFCETCREDMKKHPIKPNIVVQLPQRKPASGIKRPAPARRRPLTHEEQIRKLRGRNRGLVALWLITLALLIAMAYPAVMYFFGETIVLPGQNYTSVVTTETEAP